MSDTFSVKGNIKAGDVIYPNTDGNSGEILATDGNGNIGFQAPPSGGGGGGSLTVEKIRVNYNANFDITGFQDATSNVSGTIDSSSDSIASFNFTNHAFPPVSISIYAFSVPNSQYSYQNIINWSTRSLKGGESQFGSFTGPIQLQLNEVNLGQLANSGFTGPHAYLFFVFGE